MTLFPIIAFIAFQTLAVIVNCMACFTPNNILFKNSLDVVVLWSVAALLSVLSIGSWYIYQKNKKRNNQKSFRKRISILVNFLNILILAEPIIMLIFIFVMVLFLGMSV